MKIRLHILKYTCGNCSRIYDVPSVLQNVYGEFLLRSAQGREAYVFATDDDVFKYVSNFFRQYTITAKMHSLQRAKHVQAAFSITCDPDMDGSLFKIDRVPQCPYCGTAKPLYWEATEPPEFIEKDINLVTHKKWAHLTPFEKAALLEKAFIENRGENKDRPQFPD